MPAGKMKERGLWLWGQTFLSSWMELQGSNWARSEGRLGESSPGI